MDSKYLITKSGGFINEDGLYHWGIKGMKWGVRRYQNADGSLTAAGKKRYLNPDGSLNEKGKKKFGTLLEPRKSVKDMTDEELDRAIIRARKEDEYNRLRPYPEIKAKKKSQLIDDMVKPAMINSGKKFIENAANKAINKLLEGKADPNSYEYLKKKYDLLKIKKDIDDLNKPKELSWDDKIKKYNFERQMKRDAENDAKEANQKSAKQKAAGIDTSNNRGEKDYSNAKSFIDTYMNNSFSNDSTSDSARNFVNNYWDDYLYWKGR